MTMALEGVRGQRHALAAIYTRERPGTHCTGGWVGPRAGLDRCGKKYSEESNTNALDESTFCEPKDFTGQSGI